MAGPAIGDHATLIASRELLDDALRRLTPEWRAVIVLHYYLGMPLPDVASAMGVPIGTVKSRLHRSLGVMRSTITSAEAAGAATASGGQVA
jgi:RNA polymerase sigma-70 factor (ECF subfamily)